MVLSRTLSGAKQTNLLLPLLSENLLRMNTYNEIVANKQSTLSPSLSVNEPLAETIQEIFIWLHEDHITCQIITFQSRWLFPDKM